MSPRPANPVIAWRGPAATLAMTLAMAIGTSAGASECDCSCESFQDMRSMLENLEQRADEGEAVTPPAELQSMAACAGECAMAWGQCNGDQSEPRPATDHSGSEEPTPGADESRKNTSDVDDSDEDFALGQPRDDVERFIGIYGSEDRPNRDFFVTEARSGRGEGPEIPPGYLMIGAMWADVAPWYMKSLGELRFEQQWTNPGADPLVVEFKTDGDGNAVSMQFIGGFLADRGTVHRSGDLPEGW